MYYSVTPERKAFLDMINWAEGSPDWDEMFDYVQFNEYGPHPTQEVCSGNYCSTAAGYLQIIKETWYEAIAALGLPDIMSPENQLQVGLYLIDRRGALDDVDAGNIQSAIYECNEEWASLPGSPYGQPEKSLSELLAFYNDELDGSAVAQTNDAGFSGWGLLLLIGLVPMLWKK